jgi:hypothetical protein
MKKLCYLSCLILTVTAVSCNSNENHTRVSEPVESVSQAVRGDTVITYYAGKSPYKLNQEVDTRIKFIRNVNDNTGRFYLNEVYLNRKDSVIQAYQGAGDYKILNKSNGEVQSVALYDMILDDKSKGYLYLLKDSVTLVKADEKGNEIKGNNAVILKSYTKN